MFLLYVDYFLRGYFEKKKKLWDIWLICDFILGWVIKMVDGKMEWSCVNFFIEEKMEKFFDLIEY